MWINFSKALSSLTKNLIQNSRSIAKGRATTLFLKTLPILVIILFI